LQLDLPIVDMDILGPKLDSQCGLMLILEPSLEKPQEQAALSDTYMTSSLTALADEDELEKVVVVVVHG
jgi:hypothetical protein